MDGRTSRLNPQLAHVVKVLDEEGLDYWIDSGSLVGIMREGDVLPYDKDIDVSVWYDQTPRVERLVPRIKELGYTFEVSEYNGYRYNYKFFPADGEGYSMNIGVYRRQDDWAWRMAAYFTDNPRPQGTPGWYLRGAVRTPLRSTAQWATSRFGKHRVAGRWPFSYVMKVGVWMIPLGLVRETVRHPGTGLPVPARAEEYLTYRYGDWREPVEDWLWYRDDRAVQKGTPREVVGVAL